MIGVYSVFKGFCQINKNAKIRKKTRKWVGGPNPNWNCYFLGVFLRFFVIFVLFFVGVHVSKKIKNWIGGGWVGCGQSEFFSDFFNLTKSLRKSLPCTARCFYSIFTHFNFKWVKILLIFS